MTAYSPNGLVPFDKTRPSTVRHQHSQPASPANYQQKPHFASWIKRESSFYETLGVRQSRTNTSPNSTEVPTKTSPSQTSKASANGQHSVSRKDRVSRAESQEVEKNSGQKTAGESDNGERTQETAHHHESEQLPKKPAEEQDASLDLANESGNLPPQESGESLPLPIPFSGHSQNGVNHFNPLMTQLPTTGLGPSGSEGGERQVALDKISPWWQGSSAFEVALGGGGHSANVGNTPLSSLSSLTAAMFGVDLVKDTPASLPSALAQAYSPSLASGKVNWTDLASFASLNQHQGDHARTPNLTVSLRESLALDPLATLVMSAFMAEQRGSNQHRLLEHNISSAGNQWAQQIQGLQSLAETQRGSTPQLQIAQHFHDPQWLAAMAKRISWMLNQSIHAAEIHLDPPELGPLQVRIAVNHEQASVNFVSSQASVRDMLDSQLVRLRELFEQGGLNLLDVNVSDGRPESDHQQEHLNQGPHSQGDSNEPDSLPPINSLHNWIDFYV